MVLPGPLSPRTRKRCMAPSSPSFSKFQALCMNHSMSSYSVTEAVQLWKPRTACSAGTYSDSQGVRSSWASSTTSKAMPQSGCSKLTKAWPKRSRGSEHSMSCSARCLTHQPDEPLGME